MHRNSEWRLLHLVTAVEMAATRLHEICNRLASIRAYIQLAHMEMDDDDRVRAYLEEAMEKADSLERQVRGILNDPRVNGNDARPPTPLSGIVKSVINDVQGNRLQKEVQITVSLPQSEVLVEADQAEPLRRVLHCLVDNALAAAPVRGRVYLTCRFPKSGKRFLITVKDNGPGIPEDIRRCVFKPFFTTKPGGTGLGLFLSERIVRQVLSGDLQLRSEVGRGTTVNLGLPLEDTGSCRRGDHLYDRDLLLTQNMCDPTGD